MYCFDKLKELLGDASPEIKERIKQVDDELARMEAERLKDSESEYWDTVKSLAEDVVNNGYDIDECVDGNYWVIYAHAAYKVWKYSPNEDQLFEDGGDLSSVDSMSQVFPLMAAAALRADVQAKVTELQAEKDEQDEEDEDDGDEDDEDDTMDVTTVVEEIDQCTN